MNIRKLLAPVIAAGCLLATASGAAAYSGSWSSEQTVGGKLKTFIYTPTTAPALNGKRALMVSLHGCVQKNDDIKNDGNWEAAADQYGMVVAVPQASGEGTYGFTGCWNFHTGNNASRSSSDQKYLINLVNALLADSSLNIDPAQVYLTGLSSGAGITNQMWCIAPDVFAGVGVNAGPAPGSTGSTLDLNSPSISVSQGETNCENFATQVPGGLGADYLKTQLWNTVHGTNDDSVAPAHAHRNADIAVAVYDDYDNINQCRTETIPGSAGDSDATIWCDSIGERVSKIMANGMGHAWPSGGNDGYYIDGDYVDYPAWISQWFFANNRRVDGGNPPPPIGENALVLEPPTAITLNECDPYQEPGYTATDAVNGDISNQVIVSGAGFDSCVAGNYTIDYSVTFSDASSASESRTVTVESAPPPANCTEYTDDNYAHSVSGRAYVLFGLTYAKGSGDALGLWNIFTVTTLAETSPGYFEKGSCP
ncbi:PHB depolymerase family esterase [Microbulbifer hydrolyticus]|uniref:PHB depolymerase family esterase n=1 Tax=Microbulbifer hydrolyticus TaxID=48074 RepID=A0A6P1TE20_9GAMM|nr:PHB depolymerase family esterase [Microbulbifer hydrolyticus]MBB5210548.1 poly(3-hydroxybutyrate) depolymerase [Microbulbifer hydrolyticus]QHQ38982.1 PHB depolymerase family esterase [Microbulbifer hydrolyticus]